MKKLFLPVIIAFSVAQLGIGSSAFAMSAKEAKKICKQEVPAGKGKAFKNCVKKYKKQK